MHDEARRIFQDKPERVAAGGLFTPRELARLAGRPGLALVELAGRDSVAGALAAAAAGGLRELLPTLAYTGSEHGPLSAVDLAMERLRRRLPREVVLHPLVVLGSPAWWRALNGRPLQELVRRYGFSPVCVGCHLYLHAVRLPLAAALGGVPIISGERASHDGRLKINQVPLALDAYQQLCAGFGVELVHPLYHIHDGAAVERLVGPDWAEGGDQLGCVLSGNYRAADGSVDVDEPALAAYLREFALPLAGGVVAAYLEGRRPDHAALCDAAIAGPRP